MFLAYVPQLSKKCNVLLHMQIRTGYSSRGKRKEPLICPLHLNKLVEKRKAGCTHVAAQPVLTRGMASIGGVVVAVSLLAVSVATVFGADEIRLLKRWTASKGHIKPQPHLAGDALNEQQF